MRFTLALIGAVLFSVAAVIAADGPPVKHVVLVSVDGLAASYLDDPRAEMPTLRKLVLRVTCFAPAATRRAQTSR